MRILLYVFSLTLILSLGYTAPLAAKEKGGKPNKNHQVADNHSGQRSEHPRAHDDSRDNDRRHGDRDRDGDRDRHDGDHNRSDGDHSGHDGDRDHDRDGRHDGDHRDRDGNRDHDGDRDHDGNRDHDRNRPDWKEEGRHDNGLHKGWYKHDNDHDAWDRDHRDWTRSHRDNWWHDHNPDWYRQYGERDRDASDWQAWRNAQNRLNQQQQLLNRQERLLVEQRNLDQRLAEVQYLRQLSQRNNNANLVNTSNQLETFARQLYAQRLAELNGFGGAGPLVPTTPVVNTMPAPVPVTPAPLFWNWWPF